MSGKPALQRLDEEIVAAQDELLRVAGENPRWWSADDLRRVAANGWSGDVMMFALTDLVNQGKFILNPALRVKLKD